MVKGNLAIDVNEYIAWQPAELQAKLRQLRKAIKQAVPQAEEGISYMMPAYKLHGALVYFGAYKNHIGFYPTGSGISAFKKELSVYETSKGTVRFPIDKPLPLRLISRILKYRAKENLKKKKISKK